MENTTINGIDKVRFINLLIWHKFIGYETINRYIRKR
jgi:hypothetical protein